MKVTEVPRTIVVRAQHEVAGDRLLETDCRDYDHYCNLPDVVEYQGTIFGKTGWNSDKQLAYYSSAARIAFPH